MKSVGIISMIAGILAALSSTFFTAVNMEGSAFLLITFWLLLSGFEIILAWILLFSKSGRFHRSHMLIIACLLFLTIIWITFVIFEPNSSSILAWSLNTLAYSVPFFAGLYIYWREGEL
jgi:hypothetical protein